MQGFGGHLVLVRDFLFPKVATQRAIYSTLRALRPEIAKRRLKTGSFWESPRKYPRKSKKGPQKSFFRLFGPVFRLSGEFSRTFFRTLKKTCFEISGVELREAKPGGFQTGGVPTLFRERSRLCCGPFRDCSS